MRTSMIGVLIVAAAAALALCGCGAEEPVAPVVEAPPPGPVRLPIGEITTADIPDLMAAIYPDGAPATVRDLGLFVIGERVGLLTGEDKAEPCDDCTGSVSLYYLVRTDAGFLVQADYRDFHPSGAGGKVNRDLEFVRLGGLEGRPAYAGMIDVAREMRAGCSSKTLTVAIFTEAGPRIALTAPFGMRKGGARVDAEVVKGETYQAEFAISYVSAGEDFVTPYMFVNQALWPSFPIPAWTKAGC